MKTAVMTDSNSGIKPEEGEKLGVFSLSMPVIIDGKVYFEGKDIEEKEFYDSMISGKDVTSSQPSPGDVMDMWDSILENGYDEVSARRSNEPGLQTGTGKEKIEQDPLENHLSSLSMPPNYSNSQAEAR